MPQQLTVCVWESRTTVVQMIHASVTLLLSLIGLFAMLKMINTAVGLRVSTDHEVTGLDLSQHNERAYS